MKSQLNGKDPDAGKEDGQEEKGVTEGEMVEWHQRLNGREFEETPRDGERQGSLACSGSWGCKELDMTWQLKTNNKDMIATKSKVLSWKCIRWEKEEKTMLLHLGDGIDKAFE